MSESATTADAVVAPEAPAKGAQAAPPNPYAGTKHKVKVDGQELEVTYEQMRDDYQARAASQKRFEEAARKTKEVETFIDSLKRGDRALLKRVLGPEAMRKMSEEELLEYIEYEKLSEHEKKALSAEQRAKQLEDELNERKKTDEQKQLESIQAEVDRQIEAEIIEAVRGLGHDVKVTPRLVRRIAEQMQASLQGSQDPEAPYMPAKIAAERAHRGLHKDLEEFLGTVDPKRLKEMLPRKTWDALREADLEAAGYAQAPMRARPAKGSDEAPAKQDAPGKFKRMTTDDWFAGIDRKLNKRG